MCPPPVAGRNDGKSPDQAVNESSYISDISTLPCNQEEKDPPYQRGAYPLISVSFKLLRDTWYPASHPMVSGARCSDSRRTMVLSVTEPAPPGISPLYETHPWKNSREFSPTFSHSYIAPVKYVVRPGTPGPGKEPAMISQKLKKSSLNGFEALHGGEW